MFEIGDKRVQNLIKFGLTFSQATVYLTLIKLGESNVKRISEATNIARSEVYRVINTLEKTGFAVRIIGVPTMYKATPIRQVYHQLFQNKVNQYTKLKEEAKDLIKSIEASNDELAFPEDEQELILISSKRLHDKKVDFADNETKSSIDILGDFKGLRAKVFCQGHIHEKALKRGVKIRIITDEPEGELHGKFSQLENDSSFQVRYVPSPIAIRLAIYDRKKMFLSVARTMNEMLPCLWSNNSVLANIVMAYFEELWETSHQSSVENKSVQNNMHVQVEK
ncbi:MAG: helix-turn-helix domain-containing protein [Candidatus Bathyarchaeia archaeon]|jgi:sugar-specific transcriptional regulator TrmB